MKTHKIIIVFGASLLFVSLFYILLRVFIADVFVISGHSMSPEFRNGDRVLVNKTILGARVWARECNRFRGTGKVRTGDVIVANYPYADSSDTISFSLSNILIKRCYAVPGETISIRNGYYHNDAVPGIIGNPLYQNKLSKLPDTVLTSMGVVLPALQVAKELGWTIKEFGPLYIPNAGDRVPIHISNFRMYRRLIQYETGIRPVARNGRVYLENKELTSYRFKKNYYFLGGDNVLDSKDSRYFGLIPEDFIVGIVYDKKRKNSLKRQVISTFRDEPEKKEAAKYLLEHIRYHQSLSGDVRSYYNDIDSLLTKQMDKEEFKTLMANTYNRYSNRLSVVDDVNAITPQLLEYNINEAMRQWKDGKWARHLDFDEFCEYLLPYKCMELQPLTDWRSENRDIFRGRIDILEKECKEYNNNARVAALEVNRVMTGNYLKYTKQLDSYPIFRTSTLLSLPYGTCQEACAAAVQILRSKGIPVAVDFTPQWANRKYGHQWLSVLNHRHKSEAFSPFEIEAENDEHINRPMSKVYRMTYAPDKELLKRQKRGYRLPESLGNIFIRDVSDEYVKTENVVVPAFKSGKVGNNIYAATFNNQTWVPVACGHKKFGRRLSFKGLGRGVLYLPVQVLPDGAVEPVGEPFFLSAAGLVETIHSTLDKNVNAFLYRKYPVYEYVYRNESKLRGGVIQRSSSRDFLDAEDVVALPKDSLALAGVVAVDDTTSARYWRFASSDEGRCDMAELIFYDRDGRRLSPNLVKCGREVNPQNKVNLATAINDDDPLTFFSARGEDDIWVGFDFGIPVSIGTVNYFRRSDGNNLYPGYEYSLYFWHDGWHMIDRIEADKELCFNADVPENTLLWLVCNTTGTESRPFVLDNGEISWY